MLRFPDHLNQANRHEIVRKQASNTPKQCKARIVLSAKVALPQETHSLVRMKHMHSEGDPGMGVAKHARYSFLI
jgi:hypothetical protein